MRWKAASLLVAVVLVLLALGIVMLASASMVRGASKHHDPHYFLKQQVLWLAVAVVAAVVGAVVDYHHWQRYALPLFLLSVILLVLVLTPGIRHEVSGSYRWLKLGRFRVQPSEVAKFAVVVGLATWMTRVGRKTQRFREGLLAPGLALAWVLVLVLAEPDYGTTVLIASVGMAMLFTGGCRWQYLALAGLIGACALGLAVAHDPVRMGRIMAFLQPDKYPRIAHQLQQSKYAFALGRLWGVGLGQSVQKHFYLPEAHTDFILAIIGEELGLVATALVLALFGGILGCGAYISLKAPDVFGRLLGFGLTLMITVQAVINVGVVTGCLPTKGLSLPFISYGGSNLVVSLLSVGVLVNIASQGVLEADGRPLAVRDRAHWV